MSIIGIDVAKSHLRIDGNGDDSEIALKLAAAEQSAASYLNRNLYADQVAFDAAIQSMPAVYSAALAGHRAAIESARSVADFDERQMALLAANERFCMAKLESIRTHRGLVINYEVKAAVLLTLGHLWANREGVVVGLSVTDLPQGSISLLRPHRIGAGL